MDNEPMTQAKAEAMAETSAAVMRALFGAAHAHPELSWTELAIAATLAVRGLAVRERSKNPQLAPQMARMMLFEAMAVAMQAPDEIIRVVKEDADGGPDEVAIIPLRRH